MDHAKTAVKSHVMIVGQHPVLRRTLREIIDPEPDLEVVAEARDLEESVVAARALQPDIVVLDCAFASPDGIAAIRQACQPKEPIRVIIVGITADREHVIHSLRAGACGYLRTQDAEDELILALRTARQDRPFLGAAIEQTETVREFAVADNSLTLLLIGPDEVTARSQKAALEAARYHVVLARSLDAARPLLKSLKPDGIILDLAASDAAAECSFLGDLRQHHDPKVRHTPVLVLAVSEEEHVGSVGSADTAARPYDQLPVKVIARESLSAEGLVEQVRDLLGQHDQQAREVAGGEEPDAR